MTARRPLAGGPSPRYIGTMTDIADSPSQAEQAAAAAGRGAGQHLLLRAGGAVLPHVGHPAAHGGVRLLVAAEAELDFDPSVPVDFCCVSCFMSQLG